VYEKLASIVKRGWKGDEKGLMVENRKGKINYASLSFLQTEVKLYDFSLEKHRSCLYQLNFFINYEPVLLPLIKDFVFTNQSI